MRHLKGVSLSQDRALAAAIVSIVVHGGIAAVLYRLPATPRNQPHTVLAVEVKRPPLPKAAEKPAPPPPPPPKQVKRAITRNPPLPLPLPSPSPSPATPDHPHPSPTTSPKVDLFGHAALQRAVGDTLPAAPPRSGYRPRAGVGRDGRGGLDLDSFLVEDAGRARVDKGVVAPALRDAERAMGARFDPPFAHVDVSNKRELLHKQFMGRLKTPPKVRELSRAEDPSRETSAEKVKKIVREPFFLGRFAEVFARQDAAGRILELLVRTSSGFHSFDEDAVEAVRKALESSPPAEARPGGEVRTLWRLEATAYVVYSPTPVGEFDEATGKVEMYYPLQKRVDHKVKLVAVY